ncbi:MAG: peptide ABC transporter substrate-binding protein [Clostridia bacterium]|nr:peptide ABC transporter substrate-binding protein [Clostridia bacterium]
MKNLIKVLSLVLAAFMVIGVLAACQDGGKDDDTTTSSTPDVPEEGVRPTIEAKDNSISSDTSALSLTVDLSAYDKLSHEADDENWKVYSEALGEYYKYLLAVDAENDVSGKYVIMAMAEAKLLESGAFLPTTTDGGTKAINRVVPHTVSSALWGNDSERHYSILVATEPLKAADRDALNKLYVEVRGTGTYMNKAKAYLAEKGYTLKDTYTTTFSSDPKTWDILKTYRAADARAIVKTFDGLYEYDNEGRMVPALATSYEVSADGLTYTFKIREGAYWYTQDGQQYAEITAEDWVTGMKHLLDNRGNTEYLVAGIIKNAAEYNSGEITDFTQVGVKAVDKYTLQYTLEKPTSFFITMFGYNPFAPMNKAFFESKGGEGTEEEPSLYGTAPEHILYCGPYIITEFTSNSKIEFTLNENYYNKEYVNVKKITWLYNNGKDVTKAYNDMKQGTIDGCGLNTTTEPMAKTDGFEPNIYITSTDATTFAGFLNLNRKSYETMAGYGMVSEKTDAQKADSIVALQNVHFRNALLYSIDRAQYNSIMVGDDVKLNSVRNTYTPGTFVKLIRDVTVDVNGKSTTFKAGTYYGEIVQAQLTADGSPLKVWDPKGGDGDGSSDGFDGWFNKDAAVAELNKAIEELAAKGVNISAENPICIDYPYYAANENYAARSAALKKNIEEVLGGKVILNLVATDDQYGWYYAGYYCDSGDQVNYDLYDVSGWGPDYGDPRTYLNTMKPDYSGDMTHVLGLY